MILYRWRSRPSSKELMVTRETVEQIMAVYYFKGPRRKWQLCHREGFGEDRILEIKWEQKLRSFIWPPGNSAQHFMTSFSYLNSWYVFLYSFTVAGFHMLFIFSFWVFKMYILVCKLLEERLIILFFVILFLKIELYSTISFSNFWE